MFARRQFAYRLVKHAPCLQTLHAGEQAGEGTVLSSRVDLHNFRPSNYVPPLCMLPGTSCRVVVTGEGVHQNHHTLYSLFKFKL